MNPSTVRDRSSVFKAVLVGDTRVGKTSLLARKAAADQIGSPKPTVGSHCTELQFRLPAGCATMQVWDTAGQELYRALVPVYLREARAVILVFDLADEESFRGLGEWYSILNDTLSETVPVYLVGNKVDLAAERAVADEAAQAFADNHKAKFRKVSALTGAGVDALFQEIAEDFSRSGFPVGNWKVGIAPAPAQQCHCR
jgi:small GTP-binding protein